MKTLLPVRRLLAAAFAVSVALPAPLAAQTGVPLNPNRPVTRDLGENRGAAISGGAADGSASSRAVVVEHIAVTPVRTWANAEGRTLEARLLAYSAPAPGEEGPVVIIREGKVRFLVAGRREPVDYPLEQLAEEEQEHIRALAEQAAKGPPGGE